MGQKIKQSQTIPEIIAPSKVKESYIIEEEVDELIEEESLISTSPSISVSVSSRSSTESLHQERLIDQQGGLYYKLSILESISRSASSTSLASLGISIPSHQHFSKLIHKHEVPRKVLHVSIGFLTLWLYTIGVSLSQVTPVLVAMFVVIGSCDLIRFKYPEFNKLYVQAVGFLMREKEVRTFNGVIWYLLGLIIVFLLYSKDISLLAVLLLSWADTAASTFGRAYGYLTPKFGSKSLAGSIAAFGAGVFSSWILYQYYIPMYNYHNLPGEVLWTPETSYVSFPILALVSGLIGALSEAIDLFDDNFTIPVISATFMWVFIKLATKSAYDADVFA